MSLTPVEDNADIFVALMAPPLLSSSAPNAIQAGSSYGFGYSGMSAKDDHLWLSLKKQDTAAKDTLYKITCENDVWVRTVSDRVGNKPKENGYKHKIWVTALSPNICLLGYKCGGVF